MVIKVVVLALDPQHMEGVARTEAGERQVALMPEHHVPVALEFLGRRRLELAAGQELRSQTMLGMLDEFLPGELGPLLPLHEELSALRIRQLTDPPPGLQVPQAQHGMP